jgi:fatty acid synthase subunit beta
LVQSFEPEARTEILTAYYHAFAVAREALGESKVALAHPSALLEAAKKGEAELYALFGGQGVNEVRVLVDWPLTWGGMLTC